jgi:hypothetical protein
VAAVAVIAIALVFFANVSPATALTGEKINEIYGDEQYVLVRIFGKGGTEQQQWISRPEGTLVYRAGSRDGSGPPRWSESIWYNLDSRQRIEFDPVRGLLKTADMSPPEYDGVLGLFNNCLDPASFGVALSRELQPVTVDADVESGEAREAYDLEVPVGGRGLTSDRWRLYLDPDARHRPDKIELYVDRPDQESELVETRSFTYLSAEKMAAELQGMGVRAVSQDR